MFSRRVFQVLAVAACLVAAPTTSASDPASTLAQSLFEEGKRLVKAGDYPAACPKFAESQRLQPAPGTLLNLARCHELEGKLATARQEFMLVRAEAQQSGRHDRELAAAQRLAEIEQRLPLLTLSVPQGSRVPGLVVMLDGVVVTEAAWGVSTPLDLGEHNVEASAPGKRKFSHTITLRERQRIAVEIAPLDDAVSSPPTAMSSAVRPTPAASVERPVSPTTKPESRSTLRRPLGYVIGATGIVALGVGTFFGIRAISTNASSKDHCVDGCDADGARLSREALSQARIADVAVGLGLIGVGVGTYLMLTSGAGRDERNAGSPRSRTLAIRPYAHATGGGLLMDALW